MLEYDELKVEFEGYEPELKELAGALDLENFLHRSRNQAVRSVLRALLFLL